MKKEFAHIKIRHQKERVKIIKKLLKLNYLSESAVAKLKKEKRKLKNGKKHK